jgi:hypothetical protein
MILLDGEFIRAILSKGYMFFLKVGSSSVLE